MHRHDRARETATPHPGAGRAGRRSDLRQLAGNAALLAARGRGGSGPAVQRMLPAPSAGGAGTAAAPAQQPLRRILVVLDESGLGLGGVPVFNMELVKGLKADPGNAVTLLTVNNRRDYKDEAAEKQHNNATVVNVRGGAGEGRDRLTELTKAAEPPKRAEGPFDIVIGHSRFSGPAASAMRDKWFPQARLVHFLHTSPVRLDVVKALDDGPEAIAAGRRKGGDKAAADARVMLKADLIVGVGGLLADEADRLSRTTFRVPALHTLIPGTEDARRIRPFREAPPQFDQPKREVRLLLSGRATDKIKGVENAIKAIGNLTREGHKVKLTIRGAPSIATDPVTYGHWSLLADLYGEGAVELKPFTSDPADLLRDRMQADAVVMPSLHEGFGLVATEGAAHALPVLVNEESGAARFFQQLGQGGSVVPDGADRREPTAAWERAVAALAGDIGARQLAALGLRNTLQQFSWAHAGKALVLAVEALPGRPGEAPVVRENDRWVSRGRLGAVTRQGPGGTLEQVGRRTEWSGLNPYWSGAETHAHGQGPQPRPRRSSFHL